MKSLTLKDYRNYLSNRLIPSIYKILPLYEEKNEFLCERIDSLLNFELFGLSDTIGELPKDGWYGETVNTLKGIEKQLRESEEFRNAKRNTEHHSRYRREVLKMTALIDRQIKELDILIKQENRR